MGRPKEGREREIVCECVFEREEEREHAHERQREMIMAHDSDTASLLCLLSPSRNDTFFHY